MKKAQAAMEFLLTYGWAILIVLIALAALFYLGIFDPKVPSVCFLTPPLICNDIKIDEGGLTILVSNANVNSIEDVSITVNNQNCVDIWIDEEYTTSISGIRGNQIKIDCTGLNLNPKDKAIVDISISYNGDQSLSHTVPGDGSGIVEGGNRFLIQSFFPHAYFILHMDGDVTDSGQNSLFVAANPQNLDCTQSGKVNEGCYFGGGHGYVIGIPAQQFSSFNEFTFSFWVKNWGDNEPLIVVGTQGDETKVSLLGSNQVEFYVEDLSPTITIFNIGGPMQIDQWYYYIFTWNGTTIRGYQNGNLIGEQVMQGMISYSSQYMLLGNVNWGSPGPQGFSGTLDEFYMFDINLTEEQAVDFYQTY